MKFQYNNMRHRLTILNVKLALGLLLFLFPFVTQAQELTDQQLGFDVTRVKERLKERGITDPVRVNQEITLMCDMQKRMYFEEQKIQQEILEKIEKEQKKLSTTSRAAFIDIPQTERDALRAFYIATDGSNWTNTKANNKPWKIDDPTSDVSTWYGITVFNGHVTSINLQYNNIVGNSIDLSALSYLEGFIFFGDNNLKTNLEHLSTNLKLKTIGLENAVGNLSVITNLLDLDALILKGIELVGEIPQSINKLTKLTDFSLAETSIHGDFSMLGDLTELRVLSLSNNKFNLPTDSDYNEKSIPASFENLKKLYYLHLTEMGLKNNLSRLSKNTELQLLGLFRNNFEGSLPSEFLNLNKIISFNISYNKIDDISALQNNLNLAVLYCRDNKINTIPQFIQTFSKLEAIDFAENKLTGKLPNLSNLPVTTFRIEFNYLRFIDFIDEFSIYRSKIWSSFFSYSSQYATDTKKTEVIEAGQPITMTMCEDNRFHSGDTYQWFKNNFELSGATSRQYTIPAVALSDAGVYTCRSYHTANPDMSPLVLEREPITLNVINCPTFTAEINPGTGIECPDCETNGSTCGSFYLDAKLTNVSNESYLTGATYNWSVKSTSGDVLSTSNQINFTYNLTIPGENTVELKLTTSNGCVYNFTKIVTVVPCPPTSCTATSQTTPVVKELFKNLITKLLSLPAGTITDGYTCPELVDLAPYITDPDPAIYGFSVEPVNNWIRFNFAPHIINSSDFYEGYDVVLDTGGTPGGQLGAMTDIDLSTYQSPNIRLDRVPSFYENGDAKIYVGHINFCPDKLAQTYCVSQALTFNFETLAGNLNYNWTIVDGNNVVVATGTSPSIIFTPTEAGIYKITLIASDINKCETKFTKLVVVKNCIPYTSCTKDNPNATHIAGLFKNLVNTLTALPTASVLNSFTCPELVELVPYITDPDAKIYNFENTGSQISFSFDNHDIGDHDIVIPYQSGAQIIGFNLDTYTNAESSSQITTNYSNQQSDSTLSRVRHINFCANKIISCTESNPRTAKAKELFVNLLNHLKKRVEEGKQVPDGYTCEELKSLKFYTSETEKVYIYNFNASSFSFSFHEGQGNFDVSIPELMNHVNDTIQSVDLNYYTGATDYTSMDWKITLSSGIRLSSGKVRHIEFCPNDICVQHVAIVVDESGSLDESEKRKIKNQLLSFVKEQAEINDRIGGNMHISLIGMSDSDNPAKRRTDNILEIKPTLANIQPGGVFYDWITNYGNRYATLNDGISEGSDFWYSGLDVSLNSPFRVKPSMVLMLTDGSQTDNVDALKGLMNNFDNYKHLGGVSKPHLYVIGIKNGYYVYDPATATNRLAKEQDPNFNPDLTASVNQTSRVTPALSLSLRYLLGLDEISDFPIENKDDFRADYAGLDDFNLFRDDLTYISDKIARAKINCGEESIKESCDDCFSFQPEPGKFYVLNAWVKEDVTEQKKSYSNPKIKLTFRDVNKNIIGEPVIFSTVGNIIDGWQRIGNKFEIPYNEYDALQQTNYIDFELINESENVAVYFDDIRIYPIKGSMKTFVYDPENFKLMSELDENNYSTFYEYDNEGGLVRIKKETAQGVKTIQETRSGNVIKND